MCLNIFLFISKHIFVRSAMHFCVISLLFSILLNSKSTKTQKFVFYLINIPLKIFRCRFEIFPMVSIVILHIFKDRLYYVSTNLILCNHNKIKMLFFTVLYCSPQFCIQCFIWPLVVNEFDMPAIDLENYEVNKMLQIKLFGH